MCGRVFDPEEVSETKLNPLKGRGRSMVVDHATPLQCPANNAPACNDLS
jgi:hypothetical protein